MLSLIPLPNTFVSDISANATEIVGDLSPFVTLVAGVLLASVVITMIVHALRGH